MVLIVRSVHQRRVVERCCARARGAGVMPGMDLAHARALLPRAGRGGRGGAGEVLVRWADAARDRAALVSLAGWAGRFSPMVGLDEPCGQGGCPDGLLLDITGCERAVGGGSGPDAEARLLRGLLAGVARRGVCARVACACSTGAARALARWAPVSAGACVVVGEGELMAAARGLPVEALGLERVGLKAACASLRRVGLRTVGAVLSVPRAELASRFGGGLLECIDELLGARSAVIEPVRRAEPLCVAWAFQGPVSNVEGVSMAVRAALGGGQSAAWLPERGDAEGSRPTVGLCELLERRGVGARRVDVRLERADAEAVELTVRTARATRDAKHLWALLAPMVERANLGFGVERVVVRAGPGLGRVCGRQGLMAGARDGVLEEDEGESDGGAELIDTLSNRLGHGAVLRARRVESHLPERAGELVPAIEVERGRGARAAAAGAASEPDRPTVLLSEPELVDVVAMVPDGPPVRVRWRGRWLEVRTAQGPERIGEEWWRDGGSGGAAAERSRDERRDYFRVQVAGGRWLWLVRREPEGRWFVHGLWA